MTKSVVANLTFSDQTIPAGVVPSGYSIHLLKADGTDALPPQTSTASSFTFTGAPAGTYTVTAVAVDALGAPWSTLVSAPITIPADTSPVPSSVSVTLL